ncbi:MAG: class I SAM-dependent methyltransferase [Betaproteobacteria bacterium]
MNQLKHVLRAGLWLALAVPLLLAAEDERGVGNVVYVPTPQIVVDEMLRMAKVGPNDFVIDLGSGDGRMVRTAAKKFGARGFGVDLSDDLLRESNALAISDGVADRARFIKENLFETDLSKATVITSYLLPEMNQKLRPKILNLKPGTRVVAHDYSMGDWPSDESKEILVAEKTVGNAGHSYVYLYIVPAKVGGRWQAQIKSPAHAGGIELDFSQKFQELEGSAKSGGQTIALLAPKIDADQLSFAFLTKPGDNMTRHQFTGTVKGDTIEGLVKVGNGAAQQQLPWTAKIVQRVAGPQ